MRKKKGWRETLSTYSRKNRATSHPEQPLKAESVLSPIRKRAAKCAAPQATGLSEATPSAEVAMEEPAAAP
jgi:hypothetical protein